MRVSRTGSSRLRELNGACAESTRTRHRCERPTSVSSPAEGGGCQPPPGWGCVYACTTRGSPRSAHHQGSFRHAEDAAGNHETLDLARPLIDLGDLRVAVVALHGKLLGVAVAAEDLDRLRGLPPGHLRREQLRLRTLLRVPAALLLQPCGAVHEQPSGVDLH